ncbi:hypothetical protein [Anatilimnocola floriformis]|uniref:hypothetical protein n=1 Tax=Anatilimnocola floriformis TaxID=2948575 RepID=UPI0020C312AC|nr:hypothetical protein [Anatilimnocola floriformis]
MNAALVLIGLLVLGQADNTAKKAPEPAEVAAAAAKNEELAVKVRALVKQLDANQSAQRDTAEKDLVGLGSDVLPLLPVVNNRTPAEVRNRLARVRAALLKIAVEAATKPATVSLDGEMLTSEAFKKISEQTGNKFVDYRARFNQEDDPKLSDPKIKVSLKNVTFWEAVDTVLDAAEFSLYDYDDEAEALAYTAREANAIKRTGHAFYAGLFRLEPSRIEAVRNLKNTSSSSLRLTVDAAWEPRVRPIVLQQPLADVTAKDESGNSLTFDGAQGEPEVPVEGTNAGVEIDFMLNAPTRSVKKIASLKGKLMATVLGRVETFEFPDLDKAKQVEQERGGVTVIVDECRKNGEIFDVSMRVRFDKATNALESHRGWIFNNECYLLDPKGNRIEQAGIEAELQDVNEVGLSYKFDLGDAKSAAGYKYVYKTPAAIIRIPVEFELTDIDLP